MSNFVSQHYKNKCTRYNWLGCVLSSSPRSVSEGDLVPPGGPRPLPRRLHHDRLQILLLLLLVVAAAALLLGRLQDGAPLRQHLLDVLLAVAARQLQRGEAAVVGQVDI